MSAAKYKMIKENPTVSLIIDNRQLTTNACGALIQGKAKTFSVTRTVLSILSVGPKAAGFSKKYPGMLGFYARGKGLPDERKLYKYRIIRLDPTKIVYWVGYSFGRYVPKRREGIGRKLGLAKGGQGTDEIAGLFATADEELVQGESTADHDWLVNLDKESSGVGLTEDERALISSFKTASNSQRPEVSREEKRLLSRWRSGK